MTKTRYIARTHISLTVRTDKGSRHVSFLPITGGKSVYYTDDEELQKQLERHHSYGHLFRRDVNYEKEKALAAEAANKKKEQAAQTEDKREKKFTELPTAKQWLVDNGFLERTRKDKLSRADTIKIAAKNGYKIIIEG